MQQISSFSSATPVRFCSQSDCPIFARLYFQTADTTEGDFAGRCSGGLAREIQRRLHRSLPCFSRQSEGERSIESPLPSKLAARRSQDKEERLGGPDSRGFGFRNTSELPGRKYR